MQYIYILHNLWLCKRNSWLTPDTCQVQSPQEPFKNATYKRKPLHHNLPFAQLLWWLGCCCLSLSIWTCNLRALCIIRSVGRSYIIQRSPKLLLGDRWSFTHKQPPNTYAICPDAHTARSDPPHCPANSLISPAHSLSKCFIIFYYLSSKTI